MGGQPGLDRERGWLESMVRRGLGSYSVAPGRLLGCAKERGEWQVAELPQSSCQTLTWRMVNPVQPLRKKQAREMKPTPRVSSNGTEPQATSSWMGWAFRLHLTVKLGTREDLNKALAHDHTQHG